MYFVKTSKNQEPAVTEQGGGVAGTSHRSHFL